MGHKRRRVQPKQTEQGYLELKKRNGYTVKPTNPVPEPPQPVPVVEEK